MCVVDEFQVEQYADDDQCFDSSSGGACGETVDPPISTQTDNTDNTVVCSRCGLQSARPTWLTESDFRECPFVCENCRCKDCSIVLEIECECGIAHAQRSSNDPNLCAECEGIRERIAFAISGAKFDPELLRLRKADIERERRGYLRDEYKPEKLEKKKGKFNVETSDSIETGGC